MAEHGLPLDTSSVLGIALDGLGYGTHDTLWGGEFLVADYREFKRVAYLEPIAMLGGTQAIRQPWRNTYAYLMTALSWEHLVEQFGDLELVQFLADQPRSQLDHMLTTGTRSPLASSAGRLFDALAAAIGVCRDAASYEGQAAIELEALIQPDIPQMPPYPFQTSALMWNAGCACLQHPCGFPSCEIFKTGSSQLTWLLDFMRGWPKRSRLWQSP
jgi:hydrogenase maturation protein HypF